MELRPMKREDLAEVVPLYINYYNSREGGAWTEETVTRRILQVLDAPDAHCFVAEEDGAVAGFAMGRMEQYDDLAAYDLVEIVVEGGRQNRGVGTWLMGELERRVKELGAAMVQLQAVNDGPHHRFYGRLGYKDANSHVIKTKFL